MKAITTRFIILLGLLVSASIGHAQETEQDAAPRLLLFGTFHFNDAGLDEIKADDIDVFQPEIQTYLEELSQHLADFEPTHVMLEYSPGNEELINERYRAYLVEDFELPANENYQLGFRIAARAGLDRVHSLDHRDVEWRASEMFEYGQANESPELAMLKSFFVDFTEQVNRDRQTMTMRELLLKHNDPEFDALNKDLYLMTNVIGVDHNWIGADSAASWWQRNFRMYARLQKVAEPGARILAIAGQGHTAILKSLADIDRRIERVQVVPYL